MFALISPFSISSARRSGVANGFLLAIVAALAVGVGVTGTLLWTQRGAAPPPATVAPATGAAAVAPVAPSDSGLPPGLPSVPPGLPSGIPSGIPANGAMDAGPNVPANAAAPSAPPSPPSIAGMSAPEAALTLGNYYYDQQQWTQAIGSYRAALAGGYDNPNVRTDYGNSLRFAGQPKQALEQYRIAQKEDPTHEQSLFNQGGLWAFALKDKRQGVAAWRAYLKKFPTGQSAAQARQFIQDNS